MGYDEFEKAFLTTSSAPAISPGAPSVTTSSGSASRAAGRPRPDRWSPTRRGGDRWLSPVTPGKKFCRSCGAALHAAVLGRGRSGDVQRMVRITRAATINDFAWL